MEKPNKTLIKNFPFCGTGSHKLYIIVYLVNVLVKIDFLLILSRVVIWIVPRVMKKNSDCFLVININKILIVIYQFFKKNSHDALANLLLREVLLAIYKARRG